MKKLALIAFLFVLALSVGHAQSQNQYVPQVATITDSSSTTTAWDSVFTGRVVGSYVKQRVLFGKVSNLGATNYLFVAVENDTSAKKIIRIAPSDYEYIPQVVARWIRFKSAASTTVKLYNLYASPALQDSLTRP